MDRGVFLRAWRTDAGLSMERVAQLARLSTAHLVGIEEGRHDAGFEELERLASVLGLRPEETFEEDITDSALLDGIRILMKSAVAYQPTEGVRLRILEAAAAARDLLDLLADTAPDKPGFQRFSFQPVSHDLPWKDGDRLAAKVRRTLGLDGPVASMRDLVRETLGIPLVGADLTELGPDGFSYYAPGRRAVIVLNLAGKNSDPLVRRFSLAHELGHVLFDRPVAGGYGVACKVDPTRGLDVESRANAFAMRLLLPYAPVRKLGEAVLEPSKFRALMERWGVHYSALHLYVEKLLKLSREDAEARLPNVDRSGPNRWAGAEELPEERRGLQSVPLPRRGELARRVLEAVRSDRLSRARARELLGVGADVSVETLAAEADVPLHGE